METAGGFNVEGEELQMLLFADDIVLVADDLEKLQKLINELNNKTKKIRLSIHDSKTKWMKDAFCPLLTMKLGNENIDFVEQYSCLGQIVQMNNDKGLEQYEESDGVTSRRLANLVTTISTLSAHLCTAVTTLSILT
ncbi:unnamed protein product [Toxocara canis]|uniref:Reverse transcriptase domain-containing protein n=1 Tax=Toxocara canis TaxID=6265 RepID=A0A183UD03_TOXCA|nr:unnamed protein product [Toxocara canis]